MWAYGFQPPQLSKIGIVMSSTAQHTLALNMVPACMLHMYALWPSDRQLVVGSWYLHSHLLAH
jgi:hypothetical protein